MNRRQKIIVSVTGIFIVLLALIGLTYGYFLTRITGNGNPTSISVTTANLELVYGDGTTALLTSNTPIEPGKFSSSKDFTVTNNGNALTNYAVTLEDFSITYVNDTVINGEEIKAGTVTKMEYPEDMKMTITCVIESDDTTRNGKTCVNQILDGTLPIDNSILLTNSIEVDDIHKYVLTLTYVDSGIDQSADMNKTIKGKIDIIDPKSTIDLSGTVATYQTGDYVEINSTPIKSEIVDGKYKIIGVEPGSHTLNVKYKDASSNVQTRGSQSLTIKKGEEASVSGNTITFTDASRVAIIDIGSNYELIIDNEIKEDKYFYDNILKSIAHSQYMGVPENSLYTYQAAIDNGIRYVEADVYFTSDNIPVLSHDATINRIARNTDGSELSEEINIADVTYSELMNYDFGIYKGEQYAGTKILSFEDYIAFCKNNGLNPYIEIKSDITNEQAQILTFIVRNYGLSANTTYIAFGTYASSLEKIADIENTARLGILLMSPPTDYAIELCNSLKTGFNEVFIDSRDYSSETVAICKEANLPLEVWVINDLDTIYNLDPYISGVTTDKYHAGMALANSNSNFEVVKELFANDLTYGKALKAATPYAYNSNRVSYTEFDLTLEYGYIYKFEFESTLEAKIGIHFLNDKVLDLVSANKDITSHMKDSGWKDSGYTFDTTQYIGGSKPSLVRFQFKDTEGTATENFITGVTISRKRVQ